jgi:phage terminase small subunit
MPRGGHNKKPTAIKLLEGNPGKAAIEASGIEGLGEPFVHEHLMDDARGCIEVIKQSMPKKIYSALDSYLLAAFGVAWALHKLATIKISDPDFQIIYEVGKNGALAQSPWIEVLNKQTMLIASLGDRLGLDPRSRTSLKLPDARQKRSKFAGLIGQSGSSSSSSVLPFPQASAKEAPSD